MPPKKQAAGPRPKRGPKGKVMAKRNFPNLSSVPEIASVTTDVSEIPTKENAGVDVNPTITASEAVVEPPSVPVVDNQNAACEASDGPKSNCGDEKPVIGVDAVSEGLQTGIDSEILLEGNVANVEGKGLAEDVVGEASMKKRKTRVVKVVKKVVKKVMVKKLVPKKSTGTTISGNIPVPGDKAPMEVEKPELIVATEGVELKDLGGGKEGFGAQAAQKDEMKELSVSVNQMDVEKNKLVVPDEVKAVDNANQNENFIPEEEEASRAEIALGKSETEKLDDMSEISGNERNVDLAEAPEELNVSTGDAKGEKQEEDKSETEKLDDMSEISGNERNADLADAPEELKVSTGDAKGEKQEEVISAEGGLKEDEMPNGGISLSGESEALERRKRRKTQIFIGGLDKDAKEEDIRKVFEQVGEVSELKLVTDSKSGKGKGFAFLRFASAADCKIALEKFQKVEICGKHCGVSPVEGNDTLFLGNIDKNWKNEDVLKLLQEIGVEKIDKVIVMADPRNTGRNRGFAFLELETNRDAQNAYKKLQIKNSIEKFRNVKVAWAEPLNEPDEEEMLKVKSVYAEYLPSSWNEEKVKYHFRKFGEIENVILARNLRTTRRNDFAFVNFTTREAALACIESLNHEALIDGSSKVNVKVSLAKPIPKGKPKHKSSNSLSKGISKKKPKTVQCSWHPNEPQNKRSSIRHYDQDIIGAGGSSSTAELVRMYGRQDSTMRLQPRLEIGSTNLDYSSPGRGRKRPYYSLAEDPYLPYPREYTRPRFESSYPVGSPRYSQLSQGAGLTSLPYYRQQGAGYTPGYEYTNYADNLQRDVDPYHGSRGPHFRY